MSSRRTVVSGLLALAGVGMTTLHCRPRRETTQRGPWLVRLRGPDVGAEGDAAWRGLALTLRSIPTDRRAEVVRATSDYLTDVEAKVSPLADDILDNDPPPFESIRSWFLPLWNAAATLVADSWRVPGSDASVKAVQRSVGESLADAWPAWPSSGAVHDREGERVRFAAWAVSRAVTLDCESDAGFARVTAKLGSIMCDPASCIGAWTEPVHGEPRPTPEFETIRSLALRAQKLKLRAQATTVDALLGDLLAVVPEREPRAGLERFLDLAPSEILVVPRLGALARRASFLDEVRAAAASAGVSARL